MTKSIYNHRLLLLLTSSLLLSLTLACGNFEFLSRPITDVTSNSTITALQATIAAMQTQQAQPPLQSTITISYPTATPPLLEAVSSTMVSPTWTASPLTTPSSTPIPVLPTTTAVPPSPSATPFPPESTTQGRTIVIIVTPTSVPTLTSYPEAPVIISPNEGAIVAQKHEILLHWGWNGLLQNSDEYFEVKIRPDGDPRSVYIAQERGLAHNLIARLGGGRYYWTVQIVKGHWVNDSGHPDDWAFEGFRSPESEPRLLVVHDNSSPRSQSQAAPPHPKLPFGIAFGTIAFALFMLVTRFKQNH